jgi:hypothetical protein
MVMANEHAHDVQRRFVPAIRLHTDAENSSMRINAPQGRSSSHE